MKSVIPIIVSVLMTFYYGAEGLKPDNTVEHKAVEIDNNLFKRRKS